MRSLQVTLPEIFHTLTLSYRMEAQQIACWHIDSQHLVPYQDRLRLVNFSVRNRSHDNWNYHYIVYTLLYLIAFKTNLVI